MEVMLMKGKKDAIKPLILRLGVAFVLTFSGYLYSQFRNRRIRPNPSQSPGMNLFPLFLCLGFGFFLLMVFMIWGGGFRWEIWYWWKIRAQKWRRRETIGIWNCMHELSKTHRFCAYCEFGFLLFFWNRLLWTAVVCFLSSPFRGLFEFALAMIFSLHVIYAFWVAWIRVGYSMVWWKVFMDSLKPNYFLLIYNLGFSGRWSSQILVILFTFLGFFSSLPSYPTACLQ